MWSYRYIWATSLAFFCVEVGLWMFCKLGDPAIPKIPTGIRRNRCAGDEIHKTKTQISKKIFQTRGTLLHSGNKENQYSITEVFEILKKQGGFFLDIGTRAGRFLSDSLWLEKQHDWTGLLMELNPHKCKQITKIKERRGAYVVVCRILKVKFLFKQLMVLIKSPNTRWKVTIKPLFHALM